METPATAGEPQKPETCPNCNAEITFKEKDGDVTFYDCPNCGKINLKKEQWKKMILTPTTLPEVHESCNFCKNKHSDKCPITPTAENCSLYEENMQMSNADKLIIIVNDRSHKLFKDQYKTPYIYLNDNGIFKTLEINTREFKRTLAKLYFQTFGRTIKNDSIKEAILALESFAAEGETKTLHNRIAQIQTDEGLEIWFDMADPKRRAIKVNKQKWEIVEKTPPIFRQYDHQLPLCDPKTHESDDSDATNPRLAPPPPTYAISLNSNRGGGVNVGNTTSLPSLPSQSKRLNNLVHYLHIQKKDHLLTKCVIIDYCFPNNPHPALALAGPKGSGKTNVLYFIRRLIDPTNIEELALPKKLEDFYQILDHHYLAFFDNINYLSKEKSSTLCRVITGIGFEKRLLYTDSGSFIRKILRCVGLNGINVATVEEDLLDRTILIFLKAFDENDGRLEEKELKEKFEKERPFLLGELLSVLSQTLAKLDEVKPKKLLRMADFTHIGCACAEVLGHTQDEFIEDYENKVKEQIKEALYNSFLGNLLYVFMEEKAHWKNNAVHLFSELKAHAKLLDISTRCKEFPKAPNILSRRLRELAASFKAVGIEINFLSDNYRSIDIFNYEHHDNKPKTESEKMEELKNWIKSKKDMFDTDELKAKIAELGFIDDPQKIIERLKKDGDLGSWNYIEKIEGSL